jgi:hypothetical protein
MNSEYKALKKVAMSRPTISSEMTALLLTDLYLLRYLGNVVVSSGRGNRD